MVLKGAQRRVKSSETPQTYRSVRAPCNNTPSEIRLSKSSAILWVAVKTDALSLVWAGPENFAASVGVLTGYALDMWHTWIVVFFVAIEPKHGTGLQRSITKTLRWQQKHQHMKATVNFALILAHQHSKTTGRLQFSNPFGRVVLRVLQVQKEWKRAWRKNRAVAGAYHSGCPARSGFLGLEIKLIGTLRRKTSHLVCASRLNEVVLHATTTNNKCNVEEMNTRLMVTLSKGRGNSGARFALLFISANSPPTASAKDPKAAARRGFGVCATGATFMVEYGVEDRGAWYNERYCVVARSMQLFREPQKGLPIPALGR